MADPAHEEQMKVAFYGRVSTDEEAGSLALDPTAAPRKCERGGSREIGEVIGPDLLGNRQRAQGSGRPGTGEARLGTGFVVGSRGGGGSEGPARRTRRDGAFDAVIVDEHRVGSRAMTYRRDPSGAGTRARSTSLLFAADEPLDRERHRDR